jgi:general stress protein 26
MGDVETVSGNEAVKKIRELAADKICMFCNYEDFKMESRPMGTMGIDDDGTLWFFSRKSSEKNHQLLHDKQVDLIYSDPSRQHYMVLNGYATIEQDKKKAKELWTPLAKAWFEEGVDDPDLSLIKVSPSEGHYWDTKNGRLISMLKIAVAAISGKEANAGVEGDIIP